MGNSEVTKPMFIEVTEKYIFKGDGNERYKFERKIIPLNDVKQIYEENNKCYIELSHKVIPLELNEPYDEIIEKLKKCGIII